MNQSIAQWLEKHPQSTVEEMRAIRREIIINLLRLRHSGMASMTIQDIKTLVRYTESQDYSQELQAYA